MLLFWQTLYRGFVLPVLGSLFWLSGRFNNKVRRGIAGRRLLFEELEKQIPRLPPGKRVWFHSSSMGEFEQAKPVIAELHRRYPAVGIIVTFFSPSGYEHSRKYQLAQVISYLPFDTYRNASRFLNMVRPDVAVMVRYDIWPNHIWELARRGIPTLIANATMRRQTRRRMPVVRNFHHHVYDAITTILTVSPSDTEAFGFFGLHHPEIKSIGDTRYDQVNARSAEAKKKSLIAPAITQGRKVVVVGSSWPEDEEVLLPALFRLQERVPELLCIIAPHEPTVEHLEELENDLAGQATSIRFSSLNDYRGERVIIVDSIGILLSLYSYAHVAYVGGSFRQGIHNVLEAAVYGIPVIFGPKHRNSHEPLMLVDRGGAFVVTDTEELERTLEHLLVHDPSRQAAGIKAGQFVQSHLGATEKVIQALDPYLR
jgi:3-deoxy-D-manno-octulosonic-acid transferase